MDPGGTPEFVAPELLDEPELFAQYGCGPSVDMWSAGIVLYFLLSGQTPFSAPTVDAIVQKVQSGLIVDGPKSAFKGASWSDVSDGAFDLIKGLLRSKGQERLSAGEALGHPWIQAGARMALPRRPLEAAKRMFKAQAMQAGDDVSSPFPPTLYSPSLQTTSASTSVRGMHRSQSERSSDSRDSRQKGQPFSNLSSVPEYVEPTNQAMSQILALNRSTSLAPRSDQLNEAYLMSRRSQSSRRDVSGKQASQLVDNNLI